LNWDQDRSNENVIVLQLVAFLQIILSSTAMGICIADGVLMHNALRGGGRGCSIPSVPRFQQNIGQMLYACLVDALVEFHHGVPATIHDPVCKDSF
jgi:hypothetical protein